MEVDRPVHTNTMDSSEWDHAAAEMECSSLQRSAPTSSTRWGITPPSDMISVADESRELGDSLERDAALYQFVADRRQEMIRDAEYDDVLKTELERAKDAERRWKEACEPFTAVAPKWTAGREGSSQNHEVTPVEEMAAFGGTADGEGDEDEVLRLLSLEHANRSRSPLKELCCSLRRLRTGSPTPLGSVLRCLTLRYSPDCASFFLQNGCRCHSRTDAVVIFDCVGIAVKEAAALQAIPDVLCELRNRATSLLCRGDGNCKIEFVKAVASLCRSKLGE